MPTNIYKRSLIAKLHIAAMMPINIYKRSLIAKLHVNFIQIEYATVSVFQTSIKLEKPIDIE